MAQSEPQQKGIDAQQTEEISDSITPEAIGYALRNLLRGFKAANLSAATFIVFSENLF